MWPTDVARILAAWIHSISTSKADELFLVIRPQYIRYPPKLTTRIWLPALPEGGHLPLTPLN